MRVIPVIDVKSGQAVHAVAGNRAHYQPLRSVLHDGSRPIDLAKSYRDQLGISELYLADLDAIAGAPADRALYRSLRELGCSLWVDAGVHELGDAVALLDAEVDRVIIGLETLRGPGALCELGRSQSLDSHALTDRLTFSLDLRDGEPVFAQGADWDKSDPREIADFAVRDCGFSSLILLDLARVGTSRGTGTLPLVRELRAAFPLVEIVVGGGISGGEELEELRVAGASAVLVGSALHDGRIDRGVCQAVTGR